MDTLLYVIAALAAIAVILLSAVLIKLYKIKSADEDADPQLYNALNDLRRELGEQNESTKKDVAGALQTVANKTEGFTARSYELEMSVTRSLAEMQEKIGASGKETGTAVAAAIEKMQASNEKKLDEMRLTVDEKLSSTLSRRLDSSFQTVSEQLSNVYKSLGEMKELSGGITALNRVLTGVKTRGSWAETQLQNLLESIIPGMYTQNFHPDEGRDVVEFAVAIPSSDPGKTAYMPLDSKFPMEDYLRLCDASEAGDADAVKAAKKALELRVSSQAKEIGKYINPPKTTPFAVMYLGTDSLYAEIISSKSNIAEKIHREYNVLLTGPSTLAALLSSLSMGFRTVALDKKTGEIMELLSEAKTQYEKFGKALETAKQRIEAAAKSIDEAQTRNDQIAKKLKNIETPVSAAPDP